MTSWPTSRLPPSWDENRDALVANLARAYAEVDADSKKNFNHWHRAQLALVQALEAQLGQLGVHGPPWATIHLLRGRLELPGMSEEPLEHLRLWRAMFTDASDLFWSHWPYRDMHGGNTHLDISGGTGLGKSSEGGAIVVEVGNALGGGVPPQDLLKHMGIHASDKADKLPLLSAGDVFQDDDETEVAGEGAATTQKAERNTAGMLRFSQISKIRIAPELEWTGTTQGRLEALQAQTPLQLLDGAVLDAAAWWQLGRERRRQLKAEGRLVLGCAACRRPWSGRCPCGWHPWTLNLFWVGGFPVGLVGIPWMTAEHYAVYAPWKAENTQRVLRAEFGDVNLRARTLVKLLGDPRAVRRLVRRDKPKVVHFKRVISSYLGVMQTISQKDDLARFAEDTLYDWDYFGALDEATGKTHFELEFGVPPCEGMATIAKRCRNE